MMRMRARVHRGPGAGWLLAPSLVFTAACFLVPIARMIVQSFGAPDGPASNYLHLATEPAYRASYLNSFEIAFSVAAVCVLLAYPSAITLTRSSRPIRVAFSMIIILPNFIAALIRTYALMVVLARGGPVNEALVATGLFEAPRQLLFNRWSVIIAMTLVLLPVAVLPLANVLERIDAHLERAAQSMGAGPLASFWSVRFPLSLPGSLTGFVLVFVLALGYFITPALMGGPQDRVIAMDIAQQADRLSSPGLTQALGVTLLLSTLLILALLSPFMRFDLIWGAAAMAPRTLRDRSRRSSVGRALMDGLGWPLLRLLARLPAWLGPLVTRATALLIAVCIVAPIVIVVQTSFTAASFVSYPPEAYSLKWYASLLSDAEWMRAIQNSLMVGVLTALLSLLLGASAAVGLARSRGRRKHAVAAFLLSPLIVPSVVGAFAFYWMLLRIGLAGTTAGVVVAHTLGAMPLVVLIVAATIQTLDQRLEDAAGSLGANRWQTFRHVMLPLLAPTLVVATLFAFLYSVDELVYTLFVRAPTFKTIPIKLWSDLNFGISPILAVISTLEITLVVIVVGTGSLLIAKPTARRSRST